MRRTTPIVKAGSVDGSLLLERLLRFRRRQRCSANSVRIVAKKRAYGVVVGMSPSNAEGMTGWVRVDPVAVARGWVAIFEQPCAQSDGTGVRRARVAHVEVEVHLLRISVGPIRWDMVGCKLYTDAPIPVSVEHGVEAFIGEHMPAKHGGPKGALRRKIGCIEHNDLTHDVHPPFCQRRMPYLPWTALTAPAGEPWGSTSLGAVGVECADRNTQPVRLVHLHDHIVGECTEFVHG